jgi:hypothetical protein
MTAAGPEMKMLMLMEEGLHLVELRLAAFELWTTTRLELNVCSLRSCGQRMSNSVCGEASMQDSVDVASHRSLTPLHCSNNIDRCGAVRWMIEMIDDG